MRTIQDSRGLAKKRSVSSPILNVLRYPGVFLKMTAIVAFAAKCSPSGNGQVFIQPWLIFSPSQPQVSSIMNARWPEMILKRLATMLTATKVPRTLEGAGHVLLLPSSGVRTQSQGRMLGLIVELEFILTVYRLTGHIKGRLYRRRFPLPIHYVLDLLSRRVEVAL
jgi:hypothetical protein